MIRQFHRSVRLDMKPSGEFPYAWVDVRWQPFKCQQRLMLARIEPDGTRRLFREVQKEPRLMAQFRKRPIFTRCEIPLIALRAILNCMASRSFYTVSYYDTYSKTRHRAPNFSKMCQRAWSPRTFQSACTTG